MDYNSILRHLKLFINFIKPEDPFMFELNLGLFIGFLLLLLQLLIIIIL